MKREQGRTSREGEEEDGRGGGGWKGRRRMEVRRRMEGE
jgi:hypothetical protein